MKTNSTANSTPTTPTFNQTHIPTVSPPYTQQKPPANIRAVKWDNRVPTSHAGSIERQLKYCVFVNSLQFTGGSLA